MLIRMVILWFLGCLALPGLPFQVQGPELPGHAFEMRWPDAGKFTLEGRFEARMPPQDVLSQTLEHCLRCMNTSDREDSSIVSNAQAKEVLPSPLRGLRSLPPAFERSETLELAEGCSRWTSTESVAGPSGMATLSLVHIRMPDRIVSWSVNDGTRSRIDISPVTPQPAGLGGSASLYARWVAALDALRAKRVPVIEERSTGQLCASFDLSDVDVDTLLKVYRCPLEVLDVLGKVLVSERQNERSRTLELQWLDRKGALVRSDSVTWGSECVLPTEMEGECFAPGTSFVVKSYDIHIRQLAPTSDCDAIGWIPQPGDHVVDGRFPVAQSYVIDEHGQAPDALSMLAESDRKLELLHSGAAAAPTYERLAVSEDEARLHAALSLEIPWSVVQLGPQPVGSVRRVEFQIRNVGPIPVDLGEVRKDCGCLEARLDSNVIGPTRQVTLSVTQEITSVGEKQTEVTIPVLSSPLTPLRFEILSEGKRAPLVLPDPILAGRIDPADPVMFDVYVYPNGCSPPGTTPSIESDEATVASSVWSYESDQARWHASVAMVPHDMADLGLGSCSMRVRSSGCADPSREVPVVFERVPKGLQDRWPDCLAFVDDSRPEGVELRFPVRVTGLRDPGCELAQIGIRATISPMDVDSDTVRLKVEQEPAPGCHAAVVWLETSMGRVRLKVVRHWSAVSTIEVVGNAKE